MKINPTSEIGVNIISYQDFFKIFSLLPKHMRQFTLFFKKKMVKVWLT